MWSPAFCIKSRWQSSSRSSQLFCQCGVWIYLLAVDAVCLKAAPSQAAKAPALVKGKASTKAGADTSFL